MRASLAPALVAGMGSTVLFSSFAHASPADCADEPTLEAIVTCIRGFMPGNGSGIFAPPNPTEKAALAGVMQSMLGGACDFTLPTAVSAYMRVQTVTDIETGRDYCLLFEARDANADGAVDRGLGALLVDPLAERELSHQAPHPIADAGTDVEAVSIFKWTYSRSYLLAGAHRDAATSGAACTGDHARSDVAHDPGNFFYAANEVLLGHYGGNVWWAIQWHGMAASTCSSSDVHLTNGRDASPGNGSGIAVLRRNVLALHPSWKITLSGNRKCDLDATENVEGRLLNNVASAGVCSADATSATGRFFHIEQDPGFRSAGDWIDAVDATF